MFLAVVQTALLSHVLESEKTFQSNSQLHVEILISILDCRRSLAALVMYHFFCELRVWTMKSGHGSEEYLRDISMNSIYTQVYDLTFWYR